MALRDDSAPAPNADPKARAKPWLRAQTRAGRGAARNTVLAAAGGTLLGIGQAFCAASVLALALSGAPAGSAGFLAGFALLAVLRAGTAIVADRAGFAAGAAARRRLRSDLLDRLLHARTATLRGRHSADLAGVIVDQVEALEPYFARYIPAATLAFLAPLLVLIAAFWADPLAGLVLLGTGLLVPAGMAVAGIGAAAAAAGQFKAMTRLQTRFLDRVRGIATIMLHGRAEDEARALSAAADELRLRTMRVLRVAFLSSAVLDLAAVLALVLLAIHYVQAFRSTPPGNLHAADWRSALFALLLVPEFFAPLRAFSAAYQDRFRAATAAEAMVAIPDRAPEPPVRAIRTVEARGVAVTFEHVSFAWDPARGHALDRLSFRVPAGEMVVLAGPSGAGKSTVIEMLLGFIRPDEGRVTINGADIAEIVPQALSRLTAWIGQRPLLFAGTIRDNIRFARPEAPAEDVDQAAAAARVLDFARDLPDGMDTLIGEGGFGLSGGQAQRVAIARAYLKNAPLLLLDEPTAHLDPATEAEVLESLRRLTLGRTVVMASHSAAAQAFGGRRIDLRAGRIAQARGVA